MKFFLSFAFSSSLALIISRHWGERFFSGAPLYRVACLSWTFFLPPLSLSLSFLAGSDIGRWCLTTFSFFWIFRTIAALYRFAALRTSSPPTSRVASFPFGRKKRLPTLLGPSFKKLVARIGWIFFFISSPPFLRLMGPPS